MLLIGFRPQSVVITKCSNTLTSWPNGVLWTFQNTNLVHNSFNLHQYICYTTLLNIFRAARCSSSGGPIVSPEAVVIQLVLLIMSSLLLETC